MNIWIISKGSGIVPYAGLKQRIINGELFLLGTMDFLLIKHTASTKYRAAKSVVVYPIPDGSSYPSDC